MEVMFEIIKRVKPGGATFSFTFNEKAYIGNVECITYWFRIYGILFIKLKNVRSCIGSEFSYVPDAIGLRIFCANIEMRGREIILDFPNGNQPTHFGAIFSFRT